MDPGSSHGDICVQACANDPQVAVHAIRNLARVAFGTAAVRYSQLGFGRTSSTTREQATPRNLFGFKDGTNNLKAEDTGALDAHVWVADGDGPAWMTRRHLPGDAPHPDAHRELGPHNASRAGAGHRPTEGQRRADRVRRRVRRPGLRHQELEGHAADRRGRPRPAGVRRTPRRHRDPAPRLQLHRRLRRFRPSRRRAVLHRVRAQSRHAVRPHADGTVAPRCAQRVHHPHGHGACSRARRDCATATRRPTGARRCCPEPRALRSRSVADRPPRTRRPAAGHRASASAPATRPRSRRRAAATSSSSGTSGCDDRRRWSARPCGRCP